MVDYHPPYEDLKFVLNDVLGVGALDHPGFDKLDEDLLSSIVDAFGEFAAKEIGSCNAEGDRVGASLGPEGVLSAPGFAQAYTGFVAGGWPALTCREADGGEGMPGILYSLMEEMLSGANLSFAMAPLISPGAYRVIREHGTDEIRARYLPKIVSGEWTTAMSLTEPQCGSALGLLRTRAEPDGEGAYRILGTKMFNSWADHDMSENVVHLVLARLPDAPEGVKGISLFLVPKYLVGPDGTLGERNAFAVGSLEKKLGVHASPTCVTNFDGATGYLIGKPHRGMAAMFVIMNHMRLASGVCAVGVADAAYRNALTYTKDRLAGRSVSGPKYPELPADPIIVHPDVRRMLMTQRAIVEGGRALCYWTSLTLDLAEAHPDAEQRAAADALVSLLTPVIKAFLTDRAFECADMALQCFGGHGFIWENGAEQYLRDVRMLRLGEGTSGIQAMDFIGRKVVGDDGRALGLFLDSVAGTLDALDTDDDDLAGLGRDLRAALETTVGLVREELPRWKSDPERMAAASLDFLTLIGYLALGFLWVRMAATARRGLASAGSAFLQNKIHTARFYGAYLLPEVGVLAARVRAGAEATMAIPETTF
ncbi:acyl-CoA dehydrogenase C-terminal domain-containing protein [Pseudonocardia sp. RS11V-5]|uniref:acyl-CoA dehydrogenase C-terminal domain-containing protein n=1 Tax=Pseudonocardia terrae TaxID=2905831 RepID=UPI001E2F1700|nr:acyl-CoA dehydrogenase C-terminal domain-containing protein [Pseudonocardia terrae]MCE3555813.1 acyl-CoA dehydrogenase C-terminal domain-containing protein [Pseudonocardia terrae]